MREQTRRFRKLAAGWRWRLQYVVGTPIPAEYDAELADTIRRVRRHTITTAPRIAALCDAVEYVVEAGIEGDIVECGVWKGGSLMAAAITLERMGVEDRGLYGFDTFAGMPQPGQADVDSDYDGYSLQKRWCRQARGQTSTWASESVEAVRAKLESTGYPPERVHLVAGMVEETLPARAPDTISLLRLDTDWYASTKHELVHLYPRLSEGGVLILDDYGHYEGARSAVDEYLQETAQNMLLTRIDFSGRVAVKPPSPVGTRT